MFKLKNPGDERGVSIVLGAILVIGVVIATISALLGVWIPREQERLAQEHALEVRKSFGELQLAIERLEDGGSEVVDVGMNPGQVPFFGGTTKAGELSAEPLAYRIQKKDFMACIADAYVTQNHPENNFENDLVRVGFYDGHENMSFLKFDLRDLSSSAPSGTIAISSVRLCLFGKGSTLYGAWVGVYGVENDDWDESTITWNNRPLVGNLLHENKVDRQLKLCSWDVTSFVRNQYQADGEASFCLKLPSLGDNYTAEFNSKEAGLFPPKLEVEFYYLPSSATYVSEYDNRKGNVGNFGAMQEAGDEAYATLREGVFFSSDADNSSDPVEIDPTFGYENVGASYGDIKDVIAGSKFYCSGGNATSITVFLDIDVVSPFDTAFFNCAIYDSSLNFVASSSEQQWGYGTYSGWYTFGISTTPLSGGDYWLVGFGTYSEEYSHITMRYDGGENNQGLTMGYYYLDGFPGTIDSPTYNNNKYSIYCNYSPPPMRPILYLPQNGATIDDNTPTFEWTCGADVENHRLLVDNDESFSSPEVNVLLGAADNTYTIPDGDALPLDNYFWKVIAIKGETEEESDVWTFAVGTWCYCMEIEMIIKNIPLGNVMLEMRHQLDNRNDHFKVKVYDWVDNAWHYRSDNLTAVAPNWGVWSYRLNDDEVAGNREVRVKIVDANPKATEATDLRVDYLRVQGVSPSGSVEFEVKSEDIPARTYVYEDGAVILVQGDRNLMISPPAMISVSEAWDNIIRVDVHHIIVSGMRRSTNMEGTCSIRAEAKRSEYIVRPFGEPNCGKVDVVIHSNYENAWKEYLAKVEQELNAMDFGASFDPDALTLTIMGRGSVNDIYYYEKVTEVEVSFV